MRLALNALAAMALAMTTSAFATDPKPLSHGNLPVVELSAEQLAAAKIEPVALGELELPTGRIVATDPLVFPEWKPLERTVPPGRYPVTLYRAQGRIAMAMLRFAPGKVARWEIATLPGQKLADLKDDEIFGYPVDAGTGSFMDASAKAAMDKREAQEIERARASSTAYGSYYDNVVADEMERNGGHFALHKPLADDPVNVAIFQSGWGDGVYASYWGLDEAGRPLVLVTDFGVMTGADGRSESDKRHAAIEAGMLPEAREANRQASDAFQRNDLSALRALLSAGTFRPADYLLAEKESMIVAAIWQERPAVLELLVQYGAPQAITPSDAEVTEGPTYPAFARWLAERSREEETLRMRRQHGLGPVSDELLAVVTRWEAGSIPLAPDAPR